MLVFRKNLRTYLRNDPLAEGSSTKDEQIQLADTEETDDQYQMKVVTKRDNEERYNIDGSQKQKHTRKREFEGRKHYNLRSRNCDNNKSVKDVDFKVESQVIKDQIFIIMATAFQMIECRLLTRKIWTVSYFSYSYSVVGAPDQEGPNGYLAGASICLSNPVISADALSLLLTGVSCLHTPMEIFLSWREIMVFKSIVLMYMLILLFHLIYSNEHGGD